MIHITIPNFNLEKIAQSGQCFRWEPMGDGAYRIPAFGRVLEITQVAEDQVEARCSPVVWRQVWHAYFDLDTDYGLIHGLIPKEDNYLAQAAVHSQGIRILRQPLWETMASFIISQNNNIPRIKGILGRLCQGLPSFPDPEAIAAMGLHALRGMGLGYRAPYLLETARILEETKDIFRLPLLSYGEARKRLMAYPGIGCKVADCVCLYALGHKEAFPMDTWMKRIISEHYGGKIDSTPYAGAEGVMQQYMFYYARTGKT